MLNCLDPKALIVRGQGVVDRPGDPLENFIIPQNLILYSTNPMALIAKYEQPTRNSKVRKTRTRMLTLAAEGL